MVSEDAERFQRYIRRSQKGGDAQCFQHSQSINVLLKGTRNTRISAKLFISSFEGPGGEIEHVVGICEMGAGSAGSGNGHHEIADVLREDSGTVPCVRLASHLSGEGETMDILMPLGGRRGHASQEPDLAVCLDALSSELTILGYTPAFAFLTGLVPKMDHSVLGWIKDSRKFLTRVQAYVAEVRAGRATKSSKFKVILQTPLAMHMGWEFKASCTLCVEDLSTASEFRGLRAHEGEVLAISAVLHKVRRQLMRTPSIAEAPTQPSASGSAGPALGPTPEEERPVPNVADSALSGDSGSPSEPGTLTTTEAGTLSRGGTTEAADVRAGVDRPRGQKRSPAFEVAVIIDGMSQDLTIIECSPAFALMSGPVPVQEKIGLLGWIADDDEDGREAFLNWVQEHVNAFFAGAEHDEPTMSLTLQTPLSTSLGIEFGAVCSLVVEAGQDIDENGQFPVRAALRGVAQRQLTPGAAS